MKHYTPEVRVVRNATRFCLAGLAAFVLARAMAYNPFLPTVLQERPPQAVRLLIDGGMPLHLLAGGWIVAFLLLLVGIARPRTWTTIGAIAMCALWSVAYGFSWAWNGGNAYIYVLTYAALVGVILGGGYLAGRALALAVQHDGGGPQ